MCGRALPAFLALALFACESPFAGSDPPPAPALAPDSGSAAAAWPTPATYDLAADIALRSSFAHDHFYPFTETTVQDGVFVVAELYANDAASLLHEALTALLSGRFSRLPSRAVTVYVFGDSHPFDSLCSERLERSCKGWLGVWIKETREVMVDQQLGKSTLVHELVHPLLAADAEAVPDGPPAWDAPRWVREGIAALFERPVIQGTEIHGVTNWRLADLRRSQASPSERDLVHLDALFRTPDDLFDGDHEGAAYAVARYACQWMDSPGEDRLWRFYHAWRARAGGDPTGEASFAEVFGQTPKERRM